MKNFMKQKLRITRTDILQVKNKYKFQKNSSRYVTYLFLTYVNAIFLNSPNRIIPICITSNDKLKRKENRIYELTEEKSWKTSARMVRIQPTTSRMLFQRFTYELRWIGKHCIHVIEKNRIQ